MENTIFGHTPEEIRKMKNNAEDQIEAVLNDMRARTGLHIESITQEYVGHVLRAKIKLKIPGL